MVLTRRVNIYADKSLLAAFIGNTHSITVTHVKAAIEDSNPSHDRRWLDRLTERRKSATTNWLNYWIIGAAALVVGVILGGGFGW